jgi:nitroreductase
MGKEAITKVPINELLAKRWSGRSFNPDKPLKKEQIISLCEAARWAPSSAGEEPWRYLIFDKFESLNDFNKAFSCLDPWNQKWAKNAPVLFISLAHGEFIKNNKPNRWAQHDVGAASENICLQAVALGLMAHQMGGFYEDKVMEIFDIPKIFTPMSVIAIGYQDDAFKLEERYIKAELAERSRKDMKTAFFKNNFETPFE